MKKFINNYIDSFHDFILAKSLTVFDKYIFLFIINISPISNACLFECQDLSSK